MESESHPRAVFFDMHGVLVDSRVLAPHYTVALGAFCAERFGGAAEAWAEANREVVRRWRDLLDGLDFRSADGLRHRGVFEQRAWEMMFRLVGLPVPAMDFEALNRAEVHRFTRESDALYPDAREPLLALAAAGLALHAISDAPAGHIRGCLEGAGVAHLFAGFHGYDDVNLGLKQPDYYRCAFDRAGLAPSQVLAVEDNAECVLFAHEAGAQAVMVRRNRHAAGPGAAATIARAEQVALAVLPDLGALPQVMLPEAAAGGQDL